MGFAWGGQQNGRIDNALMVDTGGGQYLRADAAAGLAQLKGAFRATFGTDLTTSECYRPYQRQVDLYNLYRLGQGNVAAPPGGSIHGWGLAIDINSWTYGNRAGTPEHNWLIDAGRAYGWDWFGTGKPSGESWHFDFSLTPTSTTAASADAVAIANTPAPIIRKKKKMTLGDLTFNTNGTGILVTFDGILLPVPSPQIYGFLYRVINSDQSRTPFGGGSGMPEQFYQQELNMVSDFMSLARITRQTGVVIDATKLASALNDALKGKVITAGGISTADLAAAINTAVPRIAAAVTAAAGAKLSA